MPQRSRRRPAPLLMLVAVLLALMPFLFWRETWFGRRLDSRELGRYLEDERHPRKLQHGLSQVADGIIAGDESVKTWYPRVVALARHPASEIRTTAAWTMGQDNRSEAFHRALAALLEDRDLMVRRNAALALVRFGDARGREELLNMLRSHAVLAPEAGAVSVVVKGGQQVGSGTLLARLLTGRGAEIEVRSPFAGEIESVAARDGRRLDQGERIVSLSPQPDQAWEALRGLYGVGAPEDLPVVERYSRGLDNMPGRIRQQAALTEQAIRMRSERAPTR